MEKQLVVFNLADENYGVDIAAVDGIVKMQQITSVPHAPSFVEGITNLRGEVLPVVDLRKRFGLQPREVTASKATDTRIVNVEMGGNDGQPGAKVGMVVDAVSEVLRVSTENIEPPSPIITTVDGDWSSCNAFITGIAKVDERLIILIDLAKVLSTEEQTDLKTLQRIQDDPMQD